MSPRITKQEQKELLQQLKNLSGQREAQAAYALELLVPKYGLEIVRTAVGVLEKNPLTEARDKLRDLYWYYTENRGTRDPAAYTRSAILKALRQVMGMDDTELVVNAVCTYEFLPPEFSEEASLLRSTAIVLLAELDTQQATYFAVRLLADGYTEAMSGQPALTAARVLAALGEIIPLYYYASQTSGTHPEVISECLRSLDGAPETVVNTLVSQYGQADDPAAKAGLFDLLLTGDDAPRHRDFIVASLREERELDLYRYLVTVMATSQNADVRTLLADTVRHERSADKLAIITDALQYAAEYPELAELSHLIR